MKTKILFIAFIIMALAQLAIPAQMVWKNELAYIYGTVYKFKTEPVDPNDPLRGKYVQLGFEADEVKVNNGDWQYGEKGYAVIGKDHNGFAYIKELTREKPKNSDYIPVTVNYNYDDKVTIKYPFERFYMEESKAPDAERLYRENNSGEKKLPAHAIVAIKDGVAVVKDVILDGMPIKEYIEKHRK